MCSGYGLGALWVFVVGKVGVIGLDMIGSAGLGVVGGVWNRVCASLVRAGL